MRNSLDSIIWGLWEVGKILNLTIELCMFCLSIRYMNFEYFINSVFEFTKSIQINLKCSIKLRLSWLRSESITRTDQIEVYLN